MFHRLLGNEPRVPGGAAQASADRAIAEARPDPEGARYSTQGKYGMEKCYAAEDAIVDIVFVHGLTGNRENTWTTKKSKVFWPQSLLKNDVPKSRILTFGYDADIAHFYSMQSMNRIGDHARNLVNTLAQLRERSETNERPVLFVVHSLGGLVVEDALLHSKNSAEPHIRQILECTAGITFLGTPHCGSDLANWAKIFGSLANVFKTTNTDLLNVLKPDSEVLARIQQEFHTMLRARRDDGKPDIKITCFFEELPVRGAGFVVPKESAILPAYNSIGIHENHMDMPKFETEEDPGYLAVSTELWRWTKAVSQGTHQAGRSPQPGVASTASPIPQNQFGGSTPQQFPPQGMPPQFYQNYQPHYAMQNNYYGGPQQPYQSQFSPPPQQQQQQQQQLQQQSRQLQLEDGERDRVYQGANVIEGQVHNENGGKVVQGNNLQSNKDITFNF